MYTEHLNTNRQSEIPTSICQAYESYVVNAEYRPNKVTFLPENLKQNLESLGFSTTTHDDKTEIHLPDSLKTISDNYKKYIQKLLNTGQLQEGQVIHPLVFLREKGIYFDLYSGNEVNFTAKVELDSRILSHNDWQRLRAEKFLPIEMRDIDPRDGSVYVIHDFIHFAVMMDPVVMLAFNNGYQEIQKFMPDAEVPTLISDFSELCAQIRKYSSPLMLKFRGHLERCMRYRIYLIEEELDLPDISTRGAQQIISLAEEYKLFGSDTQTCNYDNILVSLKNMPDNDWNNLVIKLTDILKENSDIFCFAGAGTLDRSDEDSGLVRPEVHCILAGKVKGIMLTSVASVFANFVVGEDLKINIATVIAQGLDPKMKRDCKTAQFFGRAYPRNSSIARAFEGITDYQLRKLF